MLSSFRLFAATCGGFIWPSDRRSAPFAEYRRRVLYRTTENCRTGS